MTDTATETTRRAPKWTQTALYIAGPTCFFCRQAGQPVLPVTLTLAATDDTPAGWPAEVRVETHQCVDEALCRRMATWRSAANAQTQH